MDTNIDTKSRIFNIALRLFAAEGFENVSVRTIADEVGIKAASIYNHFESKERILEECYNFYQKHNHELRLEKKDYLPILKYGTKKEVLSIINYPFKEEVLERMLYCLLIIFSRVYSDEKAKEVYADEINTAIEYLSEFFRTGIEEGRFYEFNVPAVALIIFSSRIFVAQSLAVKPEDKVTWAEAEKDMFDEFITMLPFKY